VLRVTGGDPQRALLSAAADADRRVWALRALGLVTCVLELVVRAVEVSGLFAQQAGQYLTGFLEPVEPFLEGAQLDAISARLLLVPAAPMPSSSRPFEMMSNAAAILASTAGGGSECR